MSNQRGGVKLERGAYQHHFRPNVAYGNEGARKHILPSRKDHNDLLNLIKEYHYLWSDQNKQRKQKMIN